MFPRPNVDAGRASTCQTSPLNTQEASHSPPLQSVWREQKGTKSRAEGPLRCARHSLPGILDTLSH